MRTRVFLRASVAAIGLTAATLARAAELPNAGAEIASDGGALPSAWTANMWGTVVASFSYVTPGKEGARALRIEVTAAGDRDTGDAKWMSDPFAPDPGNAPYVISDWYRSTVPTRLLVNLSDGGGRSEWVTVVSAPPSDGWSEAKGVVSVPSWVNLLRVVHAIDTVGWLETDSFTAGRRATPLDPPLVSLTFDDGWRSAYTELIPKMDALQMRGTHFIISGFMNRPGYADLYLTRREVVSLIGRGHEVQSHTTMHQDLPTLGAAEMLSALIDSKTELEALGGGSVNGLAFPYGDYTVEVRDRTAEHFAYARKLNGPINVAPYAVHELSSTVVSNTFTAADLEQALDSAQVVGGWTILVFHRASDDAPLDAYVKPEVFQNLLDVLVSRHAVVKPVGEVLGLWSAPAVPPPLPPDDPLPVTDGAPPPVHEIDDVRDSGPLATAPEAATLEPYDAALRSEVSVMASRSRADAEVYESYRTPPRETEHEMSGCAMALRVARPRLGVSVGLCMVALFAFARRRRS